MDDERIKELAGELKKKIDAMYEEAPNEAYDWAEEFEYQEFARTVAAESRKEGIEWMIQCVVAEINLMQNTFRDTELLMEVKRRIRENGQAQLAKAERLKEKP